MPISWFDGIFVLCLEIRSACIPCLSLRGRGLVYTNLLNRDLPMLAGIASGTMFTLRAKNRVRSV